MLLFSLYHTLHGIFKYHLLRSKDIVASLRWLSMRAIVYKYFHLLCFRRQFPPRFQLKLSTIGRPYLFLIFLIRRMLNINDIEVLVYVTFCKLQKQYSFQSYCERVEELSQKQSVFITRHVLQVISCDVVQTIVSRLS